MVRALVRIAMALGVMALAVSVGGTATAATQASFSDEIGGTSVAAHTTAQNLRSAWATQVAAKGGAVAPSMTLTQPTYTSGAAVSGVINTATDGTTTSVARTRYTGGASPTLVGPSPNPGTASCTSAGSSLQGAAPRPTSLESNAACSTTAGFAYAEVGGTGENTTRDAVEFTFSRPVLGFGAWFGDLETRTDGGGAPAIVRLYGPGDVLLSDQQVQPGPTYLPQSNCSNTYTGCGNNTTRWVGFVADPSLPVVRMVVIVGDDDLAGSGFDEGMGFIGPSLDLSRATISLAKSADPLTDTNANGVVGTGDTIHYNFTVTNTGTLPVSALAITDPGATGLSCPAGPLAAGGVVTCTGSHVLTQAQVNSGSFTNTATATGTAYGGTIASNPSTLVVPIPSIPGLTLTKTVAEPTFAAVGDLLHFHLTAANTGNVTLSSLTVTDPNPGTGGFTSTCPAVPATLAPGANTSCDVTYVLTQADLDAGTLTNAATASATAPGAVSVGPVAASATSSAVQQVALGLSKSVDQATYDSVGDLLTYDITATNNGNVTLDGVDVTDPSPGPGTFALDCSGLPASLPPGADGTCTATYTVTQQDLDDGQVTNVASVDADGPGGPVSAPDAEATSTAVTQPGLGLVKTVDSSSYDAAGDVLTYTVTVTNTSNVTEHAISVDDPAPGAGGFDLDCAALPPTLAPGASGTCTATYTVTQGDIDSGTVTNVADASALLPNNAAVDAPSAAASSTAEQSASLSLVKSVDAASYDAVGDVLTYEIAVSNTGNVTLDNADVDDASPGSGAFDLDCAGLPATLAPGDDGTCSATYTVTQADIDAGSVTNVASAAADSPGGPVVAPDSQATSTAQQEPSVTVTKVVDAVEYDAAGDVLTYTVTVDNTGNVTLTDVDATDAAPGAGAFDLDCGALPSILGPGDEGTCSATYEITQADVDAGSVTNSADVAATSPAGPISAGSLPVTSIAQQSAALSVVKTVDTGSFGAVGDVLSYEITVTNSGNVTLHDVAVADPSPGSGAFELDCAGLPATLAPVDEGTCTAEYTVTQADLDAGRVTNTASASATDPDGAPIAAPDTDASSTSTAIQGTGMTVTKTVDEAGYDAVADLLTYAVGVSNTGNVTLSNVEVTDTAPGAGAFDLDCALLPAVLAPGANGTCNATYEVTQADLDAGSVTNIADANATSPRGPVSASSPPVTSPAQQTSTLQVVKTVDSETYDSVGDVLSYGIAVTNAGNVTLDSLNIDDAAPGDGAFDVDCTGAPTVLEPAATAMCEATYAVTQADLDGGTVVNEVRAEAVDPDGNSVLGQASVQSTAEISPALTLDKTVAEDSYAAIGDVLHYTITATNSGNVTLQRIQVLDPAPGSGRFTTNCRTVATLAPGATSVCQASYTVTASDLTVDGLTNTVRASAPGQVEALTASATSDSEGSGLPSTGATRDFTTMVFAGVGLLAGGVVLMSLGFGRRRRHLA